ncbi:rho GTPase-activating protein 17b isoform 2-T2 [Clarias gariepinus]|uniref:rho GTPase-activating protein 17b isoform X2 n=1 Tax=Clarias gariepinus TaxID=13013 RepID=UPI00234D90AC|nr:rho GTPase-activating protein 17b isoform X2 [Clarias gariepinus]
MKKQFNRMKQLANQTVGRAEKTEVLSDDLLQIERRMENVRLVSHNVHKKMVSCLQGHVGTDVEKRHKKLPLMGLSQAMVDGGGQLGEECMIGKMMEACGEAESKLAFEQSQHEVQLERDILDPLNQLAEVEIPNIMKQRKQLARLVLDYDSARARYQQANKAILTATNNQAMTAKADLCKEEMDEAHNKVEICKDQLAADMYNFSSKEGEYAQYYVMLLEAQAEYHRKSLASIESALPTIRSQQETWMEKPAFGTALEEHLKRSNREIALPIEACVMMLLETGMKEEGLFRIAAGASKLKKLKAALDCSTSQLEEFYSDPHAVAGALKSYLRELPEPLMSFQQYDEWIQASNISDPDKRLQALWVTCDNLPKANKANLKYLVKFLAKLAQESEVNKMTPSNIAIVLGPNLLWAKTEGTLAEMAAATSVHVVAIIEPIIQHADWFFPDDVEFNVSGMFAMPTGPVHQLVYPATPEPEYASIDRRRPGSQGAPEIETPRKDSPASKHPEHAPRRTGTLNRKQQQQQHTSPAFQPPLPPVEAGGVPASEAPSQSAVGGSEAGAIMSQNQQPLNQQQSAEESSGVREPASTPPPLRNGPGGPSGTLGQLSVGMATTSTKGPSPHVVRRGTKKQAPAPPKVAPNPSSSATTPLKATPPSSTQAQNQNPASTPSHPVTLPRRHSGNQMPIQAPSHPPPQPPQNAADPDPSPPNSPTPPDTPPHDSANSGSLYRPRPVPRPRPRPSVPPPPQPPNEGTNGVCSSASKIITDVGVTLKAPGRLLVPNIAVEQSVTTPPDAETQSESTIL